MLAPIMKNLFRPVPFLPRGDLEKAILRPARGPLAVHHRDGEVSTQVPYVDRYFDLDIAEANLAFDIGPSEVPPVGNADSEIQKALSAPIGTPPLREMVRGSQRIVIVTDDNTRPTPTRRILPILLDTLNEAGVSDQAVSIVIASGTHRPMTSAERLEKLGVAVLCRVAVIDHACKDPEALVSWGTTKLGTRIVVSRHVVEADFIIGVGNIVPHHPTGWSGGAKIVLPGVAGEETVAQMHLLGARDPQLGAVETAMRQEMEDFGRAIGLDFIVNTVLNRRGECVAVVAGHFVHAHRRGVEKAKAVLGAPFPQLADITVSSTSPIDIDFFQADKGLFSAEVATRPGGEIILVTGCHEGYSGSHSDLEAFGCCSDADIWMALKQGQVRDPLTAAEALVINHIKRKYRVTVVSAGFTPSMAAAMGFNHVAPDGFPSYVETRMRGDPGMKIGIIRHSTDMLPILQSGLWSSHVSRGD